MQVKREMAAHTQPCGLPLLPMFLRLPTVLATRGGEPGAATRSKELAAPHPPAADTAPHAAPAASHEAQQPGEQDTH